MPCDVSCLHHPTILLFWYILSVNSPSKCLRKVKLKRKVSTFSRKRRVETFDFAVDVTERHDKSGTPHHISNFLGFSCSTIGKIFKYRQTNEEEEEERGGGEEEM